MLSQDYFFFFLTTTFYFVEQPKTILEIIQGNKPSAIGKSEVIKHQHSSDCKNIITIELFHRVRKEVFF